MPRKVEFQRQIVYSNRDGETHYQTTRIIHEDPQDPAQKPEPKKPALIYPPLPEINKLPRKYR